MNIIKSLSKRREEKIKRWGKMNRDEIVAEEIFKTIETMVIFMTIVIVVFIAEIVTYVKLIGTMRDYAIGAMNMEEDYTELKERVKNLEIKREIYEYNQNQLNEINGNN